MDLTIFKLGVPVTLTGDQAAEIDAEITQLQERNAELDNEAGTLLVAYNQAVSRVKELEKRNNNQSKTIEAMEGCIASEITKAFEKAQIPLHAKAGCIGEFEFIIEDGQCSPECWSEQSDDCHMCNGNSDENGLSDLTATVPWDLCKEIWLRMNQIYAEQLRKGGES